MTIQHAEASTTNLYAALAAARAEFPSIEKNTENPFFKAKFADYNSIRDAVDPILEKNGLLITQFPDTTTNGDPALTTLLVHVESGELLSATAALALGKKDPQAQGSAITYMKRYAYNAILGLKNVDEDDDGNVATQPDNKVTAKGKVAGESGASRQATGQKADLERAADEKGWSKAKLTKWYHDQFGKDYKSDTDDMNLAKALIDIVTVP